MRHGFSVYASMYQQKMPHLRLIVSKSEWMFYPVCFIVPYCIVMWVFSLCYKLVPLFIVFSLLVLFCKQCLLDLATEFFEIVKVNFNFLSSFIKSCFSFNEIFVKYTRAQAFYRAGEPQGNKTSV